MAFTPVVMNRSDAYSNRLSAFFMNESLRKKFPRLLKTSVQIPAGLPEVKDHVVIIGFNDTGKNIARVVRMAKIPFRVIDKDPEIVLASTAAKKQPVIFGNALNSAVLKHAGIERARAVVINLNQVSDVKLIVSEIRKLSPSAYILTTGKSLSDMSSILESGASDVISEQFETSVEIVTRLLSRYLVPINDIDDFIVRLRGLNYEMVRTIHYEQKGLQDYRLEISDTEILTFKVREDSQFAGKKLMDLQLRTDWGISVLAIKRGGSIMANPGGEEIIGSGDILVVFGSHENVDRIARS
ncbi:MAG: NAD-binding protein [Bacteroidia bacterium]